MRCRGKSIGSRPLKIENSPAFPRPEFDVVGVGRCCVDYFALVKNLPRRDRKVPMRSWRMEGGGQSSTALVALSRLGLKTAFIGAAGDDREGRFLLEGLREEGVDTRAVRVVPGRATPVAFILVDEETHSRTIVYLDSLRNEFRPERFNITRLPSGRCLLVDPYGTLLGIELAPAAREAGTPVIYDAEHEVEGFSQMLSLSDYVIASEDVIETLGLRDAEEALRKLFSFGPRAAVITLGERGCLALSREGLFRQRAYPVKTVDTTAAGDAFHAGFAYGILKNYPLPRTLELASALGALVCRAVGGRESLPDRKELEEFLSRGTLE